MHKTEAGCSERPVHDRVMDQAMTQSSSVAQSKASSPKVSAPVRAVFVIQKLAGLSGGAERVFIETAEAMAARGFCVRFISLDSDPSGPLAFGQGRVPVTSVMPAWLQCRAARRAKTALSRSGHPAGRSKMERMGKAIPNIFPLTHLKWHLTHGMFERALAKDLRGQPVAHRRADPRRGALPDRDESLIEPQPRPERSPRCATARQARGPCPEGAATGTVEVDRMRREHPCPADGQGRSPAQGGHPASRSRRR